MGPCRAQHEPESRPARPGVAGIFARFAAAFWQRYGDRLPAGGFKALGDILLCRTEAMGGHRFGCGNCGHVHFAWHSCNNRLCPTCGAAGNAEWIAGQLRRLLPVPYFMVTFTLPAQLRPYAYNQPERFHRLFFAATSGALKDILADPKRAGFFKSGFLGILQTWMQDMLYHPHIHYLVPGVGLDSKGQLVRLRDPDYLVHHQVFADRFRTLMLRSLKAEQMIPKTLIDALWKIPWVAQVGEPGSGPNALKYLGQYVRKSVISDRRIAALDEQSVTITVKNRDSGSIERIRLDPVEFIRRFLLHVLPAGFHRVRYFGFLHARAKNTFQLLQTLLDAELSDLPQDLPDTNADADSIMPCPRCGHPMTPIAQRTRAPPHIRRMRFLHNLAA